MRTAFLDFEYKESDRTLYLILSTFYQIPRTSYGLPGFPFSNVMSRREFWAFREFPKPRESCSGSDAGLSSVVLFRQECDQVWGDSVMLRPSPNQPNSEPVRRNKCGMRLDSRVSRVIHFPATKYVSIRGSTRRYKTLMISNGWRSPK